MTVYDTVIVAEKPGVALAFARHLSGGKYRRVRVGRVYGYEFEYQGRRYLSIGVSGHVLNYDFPKEYNRWKGVDPRVLFTVEPVQVVRKGAWKYYDALRRLARETRRVILALDADVEGESIAFEVMSIMGRVNPSLEFRRAWFSAIMKEDILQAMASLRDPDPRLANKAFARMKVDLTIGAAFTRALTLSVERRARVFPRGKFLSYGPCQTPVLYLVVKRALERESFKKKKYYVLSATLRTEEGEEFTATANLGEDKAKATETFEKLRDAREALVEEASYTVVQVRPPVPLNTIELERRASTYLNIRSKEALTIAENLYQNGLISYPRTETTIYPKTLNLYRVAGRFRNWENVGWYVAKMLEKGLKPTRGTSDDKAHPPIYPTAAASKEEVTRRFGEKAWLLYELVVRHFLATISEPAEVERQKVTVKMDGLSLAAEGRRVVYEGFYYVYPYPRPRDAPLPYLVEGDRLEVLEVKLQEKTTKPPPFLSESELLALMRKYGIGTDATMQDHIHTNIERKYFVIRRKRCIPTVLGKTLAVALHDTVPALVVPEVRGRMEAELVKIATGEKKPEEVVEEIKNEFLKYYDELKKREDELAETLIAALREVYSGEVQGGGAHSKGARPARPRRRRSG